ncbi:MAG: hypothetical protein IIZ78_10640 [Clostridiales bacterium]|nr:hypothetical protein [Clostridiales bacterium]
MTDREFEQIIIKAIYANPSIASKVIPVLNDTWFFDPDHKYIARAIMKYRGDYGERPNAIEMKMLLTDPRSVAEFETCMAIPDEQVTTDFTINVIEEFVRRRLVKIVTDGAQEYARTGLKNTSFADDMATAESFSFDTNLGVDFLENPNFLYEGIVANEKIYPMGVKTMDDMIGGGLHEDSMTIFLAPTNVGKTLSFCSVAASLLLMNKRVLYITMEDSELKIYQRIAQNLMDLTQTELKTMTKEAFMKRFNMMKQRCMNGKLMIRHYPEFSTNPMMINAYIKELKEKNKFVPEVVIVDYIGCMVPNGKPGKDMNDNTRLMLVAMQMRAIATTYHFPLLTGAQVNRGGYGSADIGLDDVASSFDQVTKADAIFAITQPPELKAGGMYKVALVKTRYGINGPTVTTIGVDIEKQRLQDLSYSEQTTAHDIMEPAAEIPDTSATNEVDFNDFT